MTIEVYINGMQMSVSEVTKPIAITYQASDLSSLGSLLANYSNRIELPITDVNLNNLEQISPLDVITTKPYSNQIIFTKQNGILTLVGVCQIVGINKTISIDAQGSIRSFFDNIRGKYLTDLDLSAYNGIWDDTTRDNVRNTTSGLLCPLVESGHLRDFGGGIFDLYTYGDANIPFFYYSTLIDRMFTLAGFNKAGAIFSDANRYLIMIMSTLLGYSSTYLYHRYGKADGSGTASVVTPGLNSTILWNVGTVINGAGGYMSVANDQYKVLAGPATAYYKVKITLAGTITTTHANGGDTSILRLRVNGATVASLTYLASGAVTSDSLLTHTLNVKLNDVIDIQLFTQNVGPAIPTVINFVGTMEVQPLATTDTDMNLSGCYRVYSELMPKILLIDFLREFMILFGLQATESNGTVTFSHIETNLNTAPSNELDGLEVTGTDTPIEYELSGIGKLNYFYWSKSDIDTTLATDYGYGVSTSIANNNLPPTKTILQSIFSMSGQVFPPVGLAGASIANIPIYNKATPAFIKANSFGVRMLLVRTNGTGVNARFKAATNRTDYKIAWFVDSAQTYSLDLQQLHNEYHSALFKLFTRYKGLAKTFVISDTAFKLMNLLTPKLIKNRVYIIKKVSNYIANSPVVITFIKK